MKLALFFLMADSLFAFSTPHANAGRRAGALMRPHHGRCDFDGNNDDDDANNDIPGSSGRRFLLTTMISTPVVMQALPALALSPKDLESIKEINKNLTAEIKSDLKREMAENNKSLKRELKYELTSYMASINALAVGFSGLINAAASNKLDDTLKRFEDSKAGIKASLADKVESKAVQYGSYGGVAVFSIFALVLLLTNGNGVVGTVAGGAGALVVGTGTEALASGSGM